MFLELLAGGYALAVGITTLYLFLKKDRPPAYVSNWYDSGADLCNDVRRGKIILKIGDRLEVKGFAKGSNHRPHYYHWAVVKEVGSNPKMIHFTVRIGGAASGLASFIVMVFFSLLLRCLSFIGAGSGAASAATSVVKGNATIIVDNITECDRKIRVNNKKDQSRNVTVLSENEIRRRIGCVERDQALIGQYNLFTNNCESFANYIRYGIKESDQVPKIIKKILQHERLCKVIVAFAILFGLWVSQKVAPQVFYNEKYL
ncbi:uncharacterized protein [Amphiura filiformis]|uniref:uncharacterized protein n=1 Tax=Amphiura filiformis TaxID=82378 RepID=UPI003B21BBAF